VLLQSLVAMFELSHIAPGQLNILIYAHSFDALGEVVNQQVSEEFCIVNFLSELLLLIFLIFLLLAFYLCSIIDTSIAFWF
jgi:hypothetical protein